MAYEPPGPPKLASLDQYGNFDPRPLSEETVNPQHEIHACDEFASIVVVQFGQVI